MEQSLPVLDSVELRILGSLIEKSRTTPDYYPMTINALTAACNQKTSRNPVVQYDEETVNAGLNRLKRKGLVATATGGTSRTVKYKHNLALVYPLTTAEVTVICLLLLRGPQTPGELNTNAGRMYEYDSLEEIQELLDKLSAGETPFVVQLPRRPGQKEARYAHLLGGTPVITEEDANDDAAIYYNNSLEARLTTLEKEFAELKEAFDKLMKELNG
ncbi:MAG TPA: YceH family protein [Chitinophagaceae bacterium]|nr:YceH family protein [Chitinophagaceae bacterium]